MKISLKLKILLNMTCNHCVTESVTLVYIVDIFFAGLLQSVVGRGVMVDNGSISTSVLGSHFSMF